MDLEIELQEIIKIFMEETDESIVPDIDEFYEWWTEQRDNGRKFKFWWRE